MSRCRVIDVNIAPQVHLIWCCRSPRINGTTVIASIDNLEIARARHRPAGNGATGASQQRPTQNSTVTRAMCTISRKSTNDRVGDTGTRVLKWNTAATRTKFQRATTYRKKWNKNLDSYAHRVTSRYGHSMADRLRYGSTIIVFFFISSADGRKFTNVLRRQQ